MDQVRPVVGIGADQGGFGIFLQHGLQNDPGFVEGLAGAVESAGFIVIHSGLAHGGLKSPHPRQHRRLRTDEIPLTAEDHHLAVTPFQDFPHQVGGAREIVAVDIMQMRPEPNMPHRIIQEKHVQISDRRQDAQLHADHSGGFVAVQHLQTLGDLFAARIQHHGKISPDHAFRLKSGNRPDGIRHQRTEVKQVAAGLKMMFRHAGARPAFAADQPAGPGDHGYDFVDGEFADSEFLGQQGFRGKFAFRRIHSRVQPFHQFLINHPRPVHISNPPAIQFSGKSIYHHILIISSFL